MMIYAYNLNTNEVTVETDYLQTLEDVNVRASLSFAQDAPKFIQSSLIEPPKTSAGPTPYTPPHIDSIP